MQPGGCRVQAVEECVFDLREATHALNLFDMHRKGADVVPLSDALRHPSLSASLIQRSS
jgi:hypothetical protein